MTSRHTLHVAFAAVATIALSAHVHGQGRGGRGGPPQDGPGPSARAAAPIDLTGYWVSFVTEDWRYRMLTPPKGDYVGVPMNAEARRVADTWDPAADEAGGNQCKSYGAAAIMRVPGRLHVTWQDDTTLRMATDAGTQTRIFKFGPPQVAAGPATWQGDSAAEWETPGGRGRGGRGGPPGGPPGGPAGDGRGAPPGGAAGDGRGAPPAGPAGDGRGAPPGGRGTGGRGGPAPARFGSLRVVTTNMRAGYLRKNGVPYSENAILTEYYDLAPQPTGEPVLVVTTVVQDPRFLQQPYSLSSVFKKQTGATGWDPTACSATW